MGNTIRQFQTINKTLDRIVTKLRRNPEKIYGSSPKPGERKYWYLGNVRVASENGRLVIQNEKKLGHGFSRMKDVLTRDYYDGGRVAVTRIAPELTGKDTETIITRTKHKFYTTEKTEYKTTDGKIISKTKYNLGRLKNNAINLFKNIKENLTIFPKSEYSY